MGRAFGGIFGSRKKAHERESTKHQHGAPKHPIDAASSKGRRSDGAAKKLRASTPDDALYSFLMAKHERLGNWSAASQLPDEMFAQIIDFAIDPALTVKKVAKNAPALVNLVKNNAHRTLLQRYASDAITESIYGKPAKEVCVYKKYIAARNAALRAQPTQNPPLGYSTGLQKRRRILKAGGIKAATDMLVQALEPTPPRISSIRSAVFALTTLTTDVERDGLVQKHVKEAGTVAAYMQAIKYAVEYSDNFTYLYIAHSLGSLTYDDMRGIPEAIEVRSEIVQAGVVSPLVRKLQKTKDADMRYLGALLLANLACDIEHNGTLMDHGVVPVLLQCIMASPKDQRVQSNCITVLFNLSVRRPDCVKQMKKAGAQRVLQKAYDCHGVNENCQILITSLMQQLEEWDGYVDTQEEVERRQETQQHHQQQQQQQQRQPGEDQQKEEEQQEEVQAQEQLDIFVMETDQHQQHTDEEQQNKTEEEEEEEDDNEIANDSDYEYEYTEENEQDEDDNDEYNDEEYGNEEDGECEDGQGTFM